MVRAPGDELAQVQGVGLAGQAAIAGKEPAERIALSIQNSGSITATSVVRVVVGTWHLQGHAETREVGATRPQLHVEYINVRTICCGRQLYSTPVPNVPDRRLGRAPRPTEAIVSRELPGPKQALEGYAPGVARRAL